MTLTKTKPRRPTQEHKKRSGLHHHRSHDYVKTYWPYLPVLTILVAGILVNSWLGHANRNVLGYATDMSIESLLTDTNQERASNGEVALGLDKQLGDAAQAKANDMAARNYWSHDTPDGKTPWTFIIKAGYTYQAAGENLAYGFTSAGDTITGWMNSPEHRANILNASYRDVGFGIANVANYQNDGPETLVVAMYGTPVGGAIATSPSTSIATDLANSAVKAASVEPAPFRVTQLQLVASDTPMNVFVLLLLSMAAALFLLVRHSLAWRRALIHGEAFVLRHPLFDIVAVSIVSASIVFSHTAGLIR